MCVFGCGFWLRPANPGWGLWSVLLGSGFAFTPPLLAGPLGCVCLCARSGCTQGSGLECAVSVCVVWFRFWLRSTNPGWGVQVCVFVFARHLYNANPVWCLLCVWLIASFGFTPLCHLWWGCSLWPKEAFFGHGMASLWTQFAECHVLLFQSWCVPNMRTCLR